MKKIEGFVKSNKEIPEIQNNENLPVEQRVLKVREIFYSIQGEGSRAGEASIFIRLAYCNKNCHFCDTDWSFGNSMTVEEVINEIDQYECDWIVWTGGEPTLQLDEEIVNYFGGAGFLQAIETNGTNPVPEGIDYVSCSPKVKPEILNKHFFSWDVDEFRYPYEKTNIPNIDDLPLAQHYYISPLFDGTPKEKFEFNKQSLDEVIQYVKDNPAWKLSVQQHKLWNIR